MSSYKRTITKVTFFIVGGPTLRIKYKHRSLTLQETIYYMSQNQRDIFPDEDVYFYVNDEEVDIKEILTGDIMVEVTTKKFDKEKDEEYKNSFRFYPSNILNLAPILNRTFSSSDNFTQSDKITFEHENDYLPDYCKKFIDDYRSKGF